MKLSMIAAAVFVATAAHADPFANFYGNTVTSMMPTGEKMTYFINRDGTFESHFADGRIVKGNYTRKDSQTACFLPTRPPAPAGTKPVCRSYPVTHRVGDTWTEEANGTTVTDTLTPGRAQ